MVEFRPSGDDSGFIYRFMRRSPQASGSDQTENFLAVFSFMVSPRFCWRFDFSNRPTQDPQDVDRRQRRLSRSRVLVTCVGSCSGRDPAWRWCLCTLQYRSGVACPSSGDSILDAGRVHPIARYREGRPMVCDAGLAAANGGPERVVHRLRLTALAQSRPMRASASAYRVSEGAPPWKGIHSKCHGWGRVRMIVEGRY
jgi:hypothetical protein